MTPQIFPKQRGKQLLSSECAQAATTYTFPATERKQGAAGFCTLADNAPRQSTVVPSSPLLIGSKLEHAGEVCMGRERETRKTVRNGTDDSS